MKSLSFFKGLSTLLVLNVLVKPVWIFLIDREIQNQVGHAAYGNYFAVLSLSYVLLFLADAGLSNMMNQRLANGQALNTRQYLAIKLWLSLVYLALCCLVAFLTGLEQWPLLLYVLAIQLLASFFLFFRSLVTAHQYFGADAWFSILDKSLVILLCGGFIYFPAWFGPISLMLFLKIQLLCTGLATLTVGFFVLRKQLLTPQKKEAFTAILRGIAPFAGIILLMSLHYRLDAFLLKCLHPSGAVQAGIYASGYRLLDAGSMVGYLAASFLVPFIARHQQQKELVREAVGNISKLLVFFGIGVASFAFLFAPWIQQLLYHTQEAYNTGVIQLCAGVLPAYLLVHVYGSVLTAMARFRTFTLVLLVSVIINVLLNLWLIPSLGAWGCGLSALASQYFCALSCYVLASRQLDNPFLVRSKMVYLATAAGLSLFFYFGKLATINVWLVLGGALAGLMGLTFSQLSYFKRRVIRLP